eukprot:ctg_469.g227
MDELRYVVERVRDVARNATLDDVILGLRMVGGASAGFVELAALLGLLRPVRSDLLAAWSAAAVAATATTPKGGATGAASGDGGAGAPPRPVEQTRVFGGAIAECVVYSVGDAIRPAVSSVPETDQLPVPRPAADGDRLSGAGHLGDGVRVRGAADRVRLHLPVYCVAVCLDCGRYAAAVRLFPLGRRGGQSTCRDVHRDLTGGDSGGDADASAERVALWRPMRAGDVDAAQTRMTNSR